MTDKKLTDDEIIKGLNELSLHTGFQEKHIQVLNAALDLINRQKSEIERFKGSTVVNNIMESQRIKREAKAEAYKEFAERLCEGKVSNDKTVIEAKVLLKEMVGEEE